MAQFDKRSPVREFDLTGDAFIDSLFDNQAYFRNAWSTKDSAGTTQVTFSFPFLDGVASRFITDYGKEVDPPAITGGLSANVEIPGTLLAFQRWADVANIAFTQVKETAGGTVGDIRLAYSSAVDNNFWGYALLVSDGFNNTLGDIWISPDIQGNSFDEYTYNFNAVMHEIGHALGLAHPFEGNIIPEGFDNQRYTIMSYTSPDDVYYYNRAEKAFEYLVITPMVYDIAAIQKIYGANTTFHAGADSYAYDPARPFYATIWDAGGSDTIDLSKFTEGCTVDLTPGRYSSLAFKGNPLTDNLGIAFDCWIENATGGSGADTIAGNARANVLKGGGAADKLAGSGGNDRIEGGGGNDTLAGGTGADVLRGGAGRDRMSGGAGADRFVFADRDFGAAADKADRITDFSHAQGDRIDLAAVDADLLTGGNQAFRFIGNESFGGHAGELRWESTEAGTLVSGDSDGDGQADLWILLTNKAIPVESDFVL